MLKSMVIKPEHAPEGEDNYPAHWRCVDCNVNTHPGAPGRAAMLAGLAEGVLVLNTPDQEVYTVRDKVWRKAGNPDGCLCIGCLEARLGRYLRPKDFPDGGNNSPGVFPASERLRDRRGY